MKCLSLFRLRTKIWRHETKSREKSKSTTGKYGFFRDDNFATKRPLGGIENFSNPLLYVTKISWFNFMRCARHFSRKLRPDGFNARSELIVKLDIRRQSEVTDVGTDVADKGLGVKWNVSSSG